MNLIQYVLIFLLVGAFILLLGILFLIWFSKYNQKPSKFSLPTVVSSFQTTSVSFGLEELLKISTKEGDIPSPYTSPSGVGSLEDGEIRENPSTSGEYWESFDDITEFPACSDQLKETKTVRFRKSLSPPSLDWVVDQAESEAFQIHFNKQGACGGKSKSDPPLAVFGRPLPRTREDQFVFTSRKLSQPLPGKRKVSNTTRGLSDNS